MAYLITIKNFCHGNRGRTLYVSYLKALKFISSEYIFQVLWFTFSAFIALKNSNVRDTSGTPQVIESCYHGNKGTFVTLLLEGSCSSCLGSIFFMPVEFCSKVYRYGNNSHRNREISL